MAQTGEWSRLQSAAQREELAGTNALAVHAEAAADFERVFGRRDGTVDPYRLEDAECVLVMAGSFATKAKAASARWRDAGRRVGLLRLRLIRPLILRSFIGGLGGKDISPAEFDHVLDVLERAQPDDGPVEPELLFTQAEWEQTQNRLALAGKSLQAPGERGGVSPPVCRRDKVQPGG